MHYIKAEQLSNKYTIRLASSSEEQKVLECIVEIIAERFTSKTITSFRVLVKNEVRTVCDKLQLAIKAYNKIQSSNTVPMQNKIKEIKNICYDCKKQDNCNKFLRTGEIPIIKCSSYQPE